MKNLQEKKKIKRQGYNTPQKLDRGI